MKKMLVITAMSLAVVAGAMLATTGGAMEKSINCPTKELNAYPKPALKTAPTAALLATHETVVITRQLAQLTNNQRIQYFATLSQEDKAAVWLHHLATYKDAHKLNFEQQAFITEAMVTLREYAKNGQPLVSRREQAIKIFGLTEAWEAFGHLGGNASDEQQSFNYVLPGGEAFFGTCTCATNDDWCSQGNCQVPWPVACETTSAGCGWFLLEACTGTCNNGRG